LLITLCEIEWLSFATWRHFTFVQVMKINLTDVFGTKFPKVCQK